MYELVLRAFGDETDAEQNRTLTVDDTQLLVGTEQECLDKASEEHSVPESSFLIVEGIRMARTSEPTGAWTPSLIKMWQWYEGRSIALAGASLLLIQEAAD